MWVNNGMFHGNYFKLIFHMGNETIQIKRFSYKIYQDPNLYLTLRLVPIKYNSHKVSFLRYVFVEISGRF